MCACYLGDYMIALVCVCVTLFVICTVAGVRLILCMSARRHVFIRVCVCLAVCMAHACVCAFNYVMITYDSQIHDVLVNDMMSVGILLTEHFNNFENIQNMSLFRYFALPASGIHYWLQKLIHSKSNSFAFTNSQKIWSQKN